MAHDRRRFLRDTGLLGTSGALGVLAAGSRQAAAAAPATVQRAAAAPSLQGPYLDLRSGAGNALAMTRLVGSLDPAAVKYGWYSGRLMSVVPGSAARDLIGVIGLGAARTLPQDAQGRWQVLRRECGFFFDLASGEVLDRWRNPFTDEDVEVVHIANDPVNQTISPVRAGEQLYEQAVTQKAPEPFVLPWQQAGRRAFVEFHSHLWAKNPLDPAVWVRESAGPMVQISDMMTYGCELAELQDASLPSVEYSGNWVHVRPWQPWMLMGSAPGHLLYHCFTGSATRLEDVPPQIARIVERRLPAFLQPPEKPGRSEGSLTRYMRTRKPAPPRVPPGAPGAAPAAMPDPTR
ncbi:MAG: DUF1838 domain-containing protein [Steroidobacteraceae bacterium]|jgi:hypothetical protein|nr:DUF1838 domain-containing protein [Steroidobacteraceae bacterium]